MFCKYCGKQIEDDSIYCKHCGSNVGTSNLNSNKKAAFTLPQIAIGVAYLALVFLLAVEISYDYSYDFDWESFVETIVWIGIVFPVALYFIWNKYIHKYFKKK